MTTPRHSRSARPAVCASVPLDAVFPPRRRARRGVRLHVLQVDALRRARRRRDARASGDRTGGRRSGRRRGPAASAPIAAERAGDGAVVAVLVVPRASIVATRVEADGKTAWTTDVLHGVRWTPDAELSMYPMPGGVIVLWRGTRDGKTVEQAVTLAATGETGLGLELFGGEACVTDDAIAWVERGKAGASRLRSRSLSAGARTSFSRCRPRPRSDARVPRPSYSRSARPKTT